jgi:protein-S-isoprenylcysteine O-methyltransferase Ste14
MFAVLISTPTVVEVVLFILLTIILVLKALKEESLWVDHDEAYDEYKKKSKLFIPYIL